MSTFQLIFDIESASCYQAIEIIDNTYSKESIIRGLQDGTIVTTTWHRTSDANSKFLEVLETGHNIAIIKNQEIDGEYSEYR